MKRGALVRKRFAGFANSFLTRAKAAEVLGRFGDNVIIKFEDDSADGLLANRDVKKDEGTSCLGHRWKRSMRAKGGQRMSSGEVDEEIVGGERVRSK